jgi:hypothetical protein
MESRYMEDPLIRLQHRTKAIEEQLAEMRRFFAGSPGQSPTTNLVPPPDSTEFESGGFSGELTWDNWHRTTGCRDWMDRTTFAGADYSFIFYEAMKRLFYDDGGNKGLLYQGLILPQAVATVQWNGGRMKGFNETEMNVLLGGGNFWAYRDLRFRDSIIVNDLWIEGPDLPHDENDYAYAVGNSTIRFNFYKHVQIANDLGWPQNAIGVDLLIWTTALSMLHEIMHHHGFNHPETLDYTPGSDYASTLPFVAERAVAMASPYWGTFKPLYDNGLWLTGSATRTCGTYS